jgi:NAD(P)-dependent dehydrogenase (short-subunit alcohol dehydrogenase family)
MHADQLFNLTRHVAIVTGGSRGLGLEMAAALGEAGATVVVTARRQQWLSSAEQRLSKAGITCLALQCDGSQPEQVLQVVARVVHQFGRIDVLVNNAGIGRFGGAVTDLSAEELHRYFAVNAIGPMLMVRALLPSLRAGAAKKIASITSTMGSIGDNRSGGAYGYRASKAALNMMNASLALELKGFTCLVLNPGWVQTDMGGPSAPTPVDVSVRGLLQVIDGATPDVSGRFFNHDGNAVPW